VSECRSPRLPDARGPASEALLAYLTGRAETLPPESAAAPSDEDLQLALYASYELHYRSFECVDDALEWDPDVLRFRRRLELEFEAQLSSAVGTDACEPEALGAALFELAEADDGPSLARQLEARGTVEQFREFMIHRSAYQLKEADPHTWGIPRLEGKAKSAMVEIQADEYGSGRPERMHSQLFANSMEALGLDSAYGAYIERLPASTLATVNAISFFGLHRRWRGAVAGHLAMFEITSAIPNRRYATALRRLGFGAAATDFYDEHVEADSVHENIAAYDLAQGLAQAEPALARDILFGARAVLALDAAMAAPILAAWDVGESSLLGVSTEPFVSV
jgi:hypothetical protein